MLRDPGAVSRRLTGHALRNANLRQRSLARAREAPPLARALVTLRAQILGLTRLEFSRRSGISRGTLRDLELGVHTPTRRVMQQFVDYCRESGVAAAKLEEVYRLYTGEAEGMEQLIGRLELLAGSAPELARRVGISPATLWEYRRGNFPLPLPILRRLCEAVEEDVEPAEAVWHESERQRFLARGYPPPLAEFWVLCGREGYAERHLPAFGLSTAALRRLRYLELPSWSEMVGVARVLCRDSDELRKLEELWKREESSQLHTLPDPFGSLLQEHRKKKGLTRREIADLFQVRGKKPARIIKSIEEDGCYSARAFPAGLAALVADENGERAKLLKRWDERRRQFHRRHRPETRIDLRLARELYGFEHRDMEPILGYASLEYQKIERGIGPLAESAQARILEAIHRAGQERVAALLKKRGLREAKREAWRTPVSVSAMIAHLAEREGGFIPLARCLSQAKVKGFWPGRLRAVAQGKEVPPWPIVERIGQACGVPDLSAVQSDWRERYRAWLQDCDCSPLGIEVRLLIAERATTVRDFSVRLGFSPSVLVRDLQRMDAGRPGKWFHVERILQAAELPANDRRWEQIYAWWYATRMKED